MNRNVATQQLVLTIMPTEDQEQFGAIWSALREAIHLVVGEFRVANEHSIFLNE